MRKVLPKAGRAFQTRPGPINAIWLQQLQDSGSLKRSKSVFEKKDISFSNNQPVALENETCVRLRTRNLPRSRKIQRFCGKVTDKNVDAGGRFRAHRTRGNRCGSRWANPADERQRSDWVRHQHSSMQAPIDPLNRTQDDPAYDAGSTGSTKSGLLLFASTSSVRRRLSRCQWRRIVRIPDGRRDRTAEASEPRFTRSDTNSALRTACALKNGPTAGWTSRSTSFKDHQMSNQGPHLSRISRRGAIKWNSGSNLDRTSGSRRRGSDLSFFTDPTGTENRSSGRRLWSTES